MNTYIADMSRRERFRMCHQRTIDAIQAGRELDSYHWSRLLVHFAPCVSDRASGVVAVEWRVR